jgi:hypothetical protein
MLEGFLNAARLLVAIRRIVLDEVHLIGTSELNMSLRISAIHNTDMLMTALQRI